ncbi:unnamed protein product [marine sediment metagenome]|uniref:Uncharacterized protein n=1 Tax=marine sediment metagenome TaxID=412755 RepID=X0XJZ8_9ZZZZ
MRGQLGCVQGKAGVDTDEAPLNQRNFIITEVVQQLYQAMFIRQPHISVNKKNNVRAGD